MLQIIKLKFKLYFMNRKWRKKNSHNFTNLSKLCDINKLKVGNKTYGELNVYSWGSEGEALEIGNYVSIANDVKFILGGNHRYDILSTYPIKVKIMGEKLEAYSNGKIVVGDEVWIGMNTMVMSGVKIGKGAIVAAGSVVIKDVEPYSIVGGNPARHIKFRFDEFYIDKINDINLNSINEDFMKENLELFYKTINDDVVERVMVKINEYKK